MDVDPALKLIVEIGTKASEETQGRAELGITLVVGGILVSGYVTTVRQFMLGHDCTEPILDTIQANFKSLGIFGDDTLDYIHLRGAKFFSPSQPSFILSGDGGVFWRGRLSEVSGFFLDCLGEVPAEGDEAGDPID